MNKYSQHWPDTERRTDEPRWNDDPLHLVVVAVAIFVAGYLIGRLVAL